MVVELIQQYADVQTEQGQQRQAIPQKLVFLNGVHVGFIGTHAGAPLNIIDQLDEAQRIDLMREVQRQLGWSPSHWSMAPELPQEEQEFDEEQDAIA